MKIDMTDRDTSSGGYNMTIGTVLARVKSVSEGQAKDKSPQILIDLVRDDGRERICTMRLTFSERGSSLAKERLMAFGIPEDFKGELDLNKIDNARVWAAVCLQKSNPKYLDIDIKELDNAGLQHVDSTPAGCTAAPEESDAPF